MKKVDLMGNECTGCETRACKNLDPHDSDAMCCLCLDRAISGVCHVCKWEAS